MDDERAALVAGIRAAVDRVPGTSQMAKAAVLGVGPSTLERWQSGASKPAEHRLARLANKSGLSQEAIRNGGVEPTDDIED
ncbi:hypothetical protein [Pseudonocardia oroxyli]|uniref:hypothetical protein n=1 Tax=Pseudonocardia oroxyli TaxID=366584 RepID=UPI00115F7876|nr:hypothetical protein [Pseudonocardia oroxyli]